MRDIELFNAGFSKAVSILEDILKDTKKSRKCEDEGDIKHSDEYLRAVHILEHVRDEINFFRAHPVLGCLDNIEEPYDPEV